MELNVAKFDGVGTCYYPACSKYWTVKNHLGRVAQDAIGRYVVYNREGVVVGVAKTARAARACLIDSLVNP